MVVYYTIIRNPQNRSGHRAFLYCCCSCPNFPVFPNIILIAKGIEICRGVYTTSLVLNDNIVDIEVTVDEANINSIRIVNLDEAVSAMYPLIEPAFEDLASQICENQSLDGITYSDDNKYTSMVLLDAIKASLKKAEAAAIGNTAEQP